MADHRATFNATVEVVGKSIKKEIIHSFGPPSAVISDKSSFLNSNALE